MDEGWTPTSDGILHIFITTTDYDLVTIYIISKSINGSTDTHDVNNIIYGLHRRGMIFEVSSVSIKKRNTVQNGNERKY